MVNGLATSSFYKHCSGGGERGGPNYDSIERICVFHQKNVVGREQRAVTLLSKSEKAFFNDDVIMSKGIDAACGDFSRNVRSVI